MQQVIDLKNEQNLITQKIIDCAFRVHKNLGPGLLEAVYEECICIEFAKEGLVFERQKPVAITYEGITLRNTLKLDLLVENKIIVELKSIDKTLPVHEAQLLTYLKMTNTNIGLLINFNVPLLKDGLKRIVHKLNENSAGSAISAPPR